jgi:hypothetical protein
MGITVANFTQEKYKRSGWTVKLHPQSNGEIRLIVHVITGRKYWPLFTVVPDFTKGDKDPALRLIKSSLHYYTFPMINRFTEELEEMLSDVYETEIKLSNYET